MTEELDRADELGDKGLDALKAFLTGNAGRAIDILADSVSDNASAFGFACGYVAIVLATVPGPHDDGHFVADLDEVPGMARDPELVELCSIAAAFIAATGNGDFAGAYQLWQSIPDVDTCMRFLILLAKMAAAAIAAGNP